MDENSHPVILFDGVCNLCNSSVQYIIKRDKKNVFRFASLQSSFGKSVVEKYQLGEKSIDSVVLLDGNNFFVKSTAALQILKRLGFPYSLFYIFILVPAFIRNAVYDFIAKNRYKWFGKKDSCMIPSPELKKLFIDSE